MVPNSDVTPSCLNDEGDVFEEFGVFLDELVPGVVGAAHWLNKGLVLQILSNLKISKGEEITRLPDRDGQERLFGFNIKNHEILR